MITENGNPSLKYLKINERINARFLACKNYELSLQHL